MGFSMLNGEGMSTKVSWRLDNKRARRRSATNDIGGSLFTFSVTCQPGMPGHPSGIEVAGPRGKTWSHALPDTSSAESFCKEMNSRFEDETLIAATNSDVDRIERLYDLAGFQMTFAAIPVRNALGSDISSRVMKSIATELEQGDEIGAKMLRNEIVLHRH